MKLQSAMEYLMTYGWAILLLGIVLASLYALGLFSPSSFIQSTCLLQANFGCINAYLSSSGKLTVNIEQNTESPINITSIGCNTNATYYNMVSISPPLSLPIGSNHTFTVQCYQGTQQYSGQIGSIFKGYLLFNYTSLQTGFQNTQIGTLMLKVSS
ncbi:MAG: hypothetical protein QXD11_02755 [Candidatus Micrarchaeaceae archaeon]